MASSSLRVG
uniref:Uncharacterized protein n=1 Tax=Arundo donax TaxID=35708 RepID=A0A0A9B272_ARUDO